MNQDLEQKLQQARDAFPRFYFLSNDDLISILEEKDLDTLSMNTKFYLIFDGANKLKIVNAKVEGVWSQEQEYLALSQPVSYNGDKVLFFQQLEESLKASLKDQILNGLKANYGNEPLEFIEKHLNQVVQNVLQIEWTRLAELAIQNKQLEEFHQKWQGFFSKLVEFQGKENKSSLYQTKVFNTLCLLHAQLRGIKSLIENKVEKLEDEHWQKQLRRYLLNNEIVVQMNQCTNDYTYEYYGCPKSLVYSNEEYQKWLLDAQKNKKIGGSYGPPGLGKTEQLKQLAQELGRQAIVINVSDCLDHVAVKKFLIGASLSGSWVIFDEFNRLAFDQLLPASDAFEEFLKGSLVKNAKQTSGAFYTQNPGYEGKQLNEDSNAYGQRYNALSSIMPIPKINFELLYEVLLYSEGFKTSPELAKKIILNQQFCQEKLSKQCHYDFGFRYIKSLLVASGVLFRNTQQEEQSVYNCLWMINTGRLTVQDLKLYREFLEQQFPGKKFLIDEQTDKKVEEVLNEIAKDKDQDYLEKLKSFFFSISFRHGWLILGADQKQFLELSIELIKRVNNNQIVWETYEQKNYTVQQMYGYYNDKNEYVEGEFVKLMKKQQESQQEFWVCMNGQFGAINLENCNTLLDDNKKLFVVDGSVVHLKCNNRIFVLTDNVEEFSPATVSRLGAINLIRN